eukprot:107986-Chlamydomonas_euryale.AAC.1
MRSAHFSWNCMQIWATDSRRVKRGHYQSPNAYIRAAYNVMLTISSRTFCRQFMMHTYTHANCSTLTTGKFAVVLGQASAHPPKPS